MRFVPLEIFNTFKTRETCDKVITSTSGHSFHVLSTFGTKRLLVSVYLSVYFRKIIMLIFVVTFLMHNGNHDWVIHYYNV